jgi:hypothetical protein
MTLRTFAPGTGVAAFSFLGFFGRGAAFSLPLSLGAARLMAAAGLSSAAFTTLRGQETPTSQ